MTGIHRLQLWWVSSYKWGVNALLRACRRVLFSSIKTPKRIIVFKAGNIGDIVCVIPSLIAIRRKFPTAHITFVTSPGTRRGTGALELISGVWYVDDLYVYYIDETPKQELFKHIRSFQADACIFLPEYHATPFQLFRAMVFIRLLGIRSARGFTLRTVHQFHKTQVDYTRRKHEVDELLSVLSDAGINQPTVEFAFPLTQKHRDDVDLYLSRQGISSVNTPSLIALCPGCKRESNRWPMDRFGLLGRYLQDTYNATIILFGSKGDIPLTNQISPYLRGEHVVDTTGAFDVLTSLALLKKCTLVVSNSTGAIHLAAAVSVPTVGFYGVRDILGPWFPYGSNHRVLFHTQLKGDYRTDVCIQQSVNAITLHEAQNACDELLQ